MKQPTYPETNITFNSNDNQKYFEPNTNISPEEQEELLIKVYEDNVNLITTISKTMQISELCSYISFLIFLIILSIKQSPNGHFNWFYVNIPLMLSITSALITINMFLYLKELFDISRIINEHNNSNNNNNSSNTVQRSSLFLFIFVNVIGILLLLFVILLSLRLNNTITPKDLNTIFIPLYLVFIMLFVLTIFFTPAFIYGALYSEIVLLFISVLSFVIFCIMLCIKENKDTITTMKYIHVFIPIYFVLGAAVLYLVISSLLENSNNSMKDNEDTETSNKSLMHNVILGIGGAFVLSAVIALQVKLDNSNNNNKEDNKYHYVEVIIGTIGYALICGYHILNMFWESISESKKNN